MRVLILTERFYPEEFLINDLVMKWKQQGHAVEVLTQIPSYPHDKIFPGYRNNKAMRNDIGPEGVVVHRVKTVLGYNHSVFCKILNYFLFAWRTSWWALWHGHKYDRVFVCHTGPLTMASAVVVFKGIWQRQCTIWTQDMWPEAVYAYGFKKNRIRDFFLSLFVKQIYACCHTILVSSPNFVDVLSQRLQCSVFFVPQWDQGEDVIPIKKPDNKVVFMFTGNLGVPQNLEMLLRGFQRANLLQAELHLIGGGVMLEPLRELVQAESMTNVFLPGRFPKEQMPEFVAKADVLVISLRAEYSLTLPGKFQTYLKAGRPMFGVLKGAAADMIKENKLGTVADPDDLKVIAKGFRALAEQAQAGELVACSERCLELLERCFNREKLIGELWGYVAGREFIR